jgi:hypothetical protein
MTGITRRDLLDCPHCMQHYTDSPHLVAACASVGIQRGLSAAQMLVDYLAEYHRRGHPEIRTVGSQP